MEKKRWRAKHGGYYHYISFQFKTDWTVEAFSKEDDINYNLGNYFETKEEAEKCAEYMKKCVLEWHEKRDNNE